MAVLLREARVVSGPPLGQGLQVDRQDITFESVRSDAVRLQIRVQNVGPDHSGADVLLVRAAPLGAFLPWRPLRTLRVPPLAPGEAATLSAEVAAPAPEALGAFDTVPPRRLLTAIGAEDAPQRPLPKARGLRRLLSFCSPRRVARLRPGPALPPDPLALLGRSNAYWAGNLNVFVGQTNVERHLAQALRIHPGRTNLAIFFVGTGRDSYAFSLQGEGAEWEAALYDMTFAHGLVVDRRRDEPVEENQWIATDGPHVMVLAICPPADCRRGDVAVHVTQCSSGRTAIVEFSLDAAARGAGCYVV